MKKKMYKNFRQKIALTLLCFVLAGCGGDDSTNREYRYDNVEVNNYSQIIYFRNFIVANGFNNKRIPIYEDGKIKFSDSYQWNFKLKNYFLNHLTKAGVKYKLKFSQLSNFNFVDCVVEEIFYDVAKKEMVLSCSINFNGNISAFYIKHSVSGPADFDIVFAYAAEHVVQFVAGCNAFIGNKI